MKSTAERLLDRAAHQLHQACDAIMPDGEEDASHEAKMAVNSLGGALNCIASAREQLSLPVQPFVPGSQLRRLVRTYPCHAEETMEHYLDRLLLAWQDEQAEKEARQCR